MRGVRLPEFGTMIHQLNWIGHDFIRRKVNFANLSRSVSEWIVAVCTEEINTADNSRAILKGIATHSSASSTYQAISCSDVIQTATSNCSKYVPWIAGSGKEITHKKMSALSNQIISASRLFCAYEINVSLFVITVGKIHKHRSLPQFG